MVPLNYTCFLFVHRQCQLFRKDWRVLEVQAIWKTQVSPFCSETHRSVGTNTAHLVNVPREKHAKRIVQGTC